MKGSADREVSSPLKRPGAGPVCRLGAVEQHEGGGRREKTPPTSCRCISPPEALLTLQIRARWQPSTDVTARTNADPPEEREAVHTQRNIQNVLTSKAAKRTRTHLFIYRQLILLYKMSEQTSPSPPCVVLKVAPSAPRDVFVLPCIEAVSSRGNDPTDLLLPEGRRTQFSARAPLNN